MYFGVGTQEAQSQELSMDGMTEYSIEHEDSLEPDDSDLYEMGANPEEEFPHTLTSSADFDSGIFTFTGKDDQRSYDRHSSYLKNKK
jgi:hypothetical protein